MHREATNSQLRKTRGGGDEGRNLGAPDQAAASHAAAPPSAATLLATTTQVRQQCPDPEQRDRNLSGQPLVTMGGGALPLPMPAQPATLTATRVATKATSTFFIGIPLSFTPRDAHFVPRYTVGRPLKPMVHRLRRQWGTSKGTVSLGTQLRGVRSKHLPVSGSRSAPRHPPLPAY